MTTKKKYRVKKSLNIPQRGIVLAGLSAKSNLADWAILDFIHDFCLHYARARRIEQDGERYTRINYAYMIEAMPLLGIKDKNALSRRIKKLKGLGLIKIYHAPENTLYIALTPLCLNIFTPRRHKDKDSKDKDSKRAEGIQEVMQEEDRTLPETLPETLQETIETIWDEQQEGKQLAWAKDPKFEHKTYTPESPIDDSLPYVDAVRRIMNYWDTEVSANTQLKLQKCESKYRIYAAIVFPAKLQNLSEHDYYFAIDCYLSMLRAGKEIPKELHNVALAVKKYLKKP